MDAGIVALFFVAAVLGLAVGCVIGRYIWPATPAVDPAAFALAQSEAARRTQDCLTLRSRVEELTSQCEAAGDRARLAGEDAARMGERVVGLTKQIVEQTNVVRAVEAQRDEAMAEAIREDLQRRLITGSEIFLPDAAERQAPPGYEVTADESGVAIEATPTERDRTTWDVSIKKAIRDASATPPIGRAREIAKTLDPSLESPTS